MGQKSNSKPSSQKAQPQKHQAKKAPQITGKKK